MTITISTQTSGAYTLSSNNTLLTITSKGGLLGGPKVAASLYIDGVADTVINSGLILNPVRSGYPDGIQIQGTNAVIINNSTGTIKSVYGISTKGLHFGENASIQNSGLISGSIYGIYLEEQVKGAITNLAGGVIYGKNGGIASEPTQFTLSNAGSITGHYYGVEGTAGSVVNQAKAVIKGLSGGGINFINNSTIQNAGTILGVDGYGVQLDKTGTVINAGTISGPLGAVEFYGTLGHDRLVVDKGAVFIGDVKANGAKNVLELASASSAGTLAGIGALFTGFQTLVFDHGAAWTLAGSAAGFNNETLGSFAHTDTLDITGVSLTSETLTIGTLALFAGATRDLTLTLASPSTLTSADFSLVSDHHGGTFLVTDATFLPAHSSALLANAAAPILDMTCFAAGTRILTPTGETPVEDLKTGDLVITAGAKIRPIIWAGREHVDIANHPEPELVRPIRITAGALGAGIPERDLRLSPHHAVLVNGELVEASSLVNQTTIRQEDVREVTYHHLELPDHDILFAEGAPCESYLDTGRRLQAA